MGFAFTADARVHSEANIWMATVRPDGRPHLVPIWFVVLGETWYICTQPQSVKARNLLSNPHISIALEDGNRPLVVEGEAAAVAPAPDVIAAFKKKYDWDITADAPYGALFQVTIHKQLLGNA